MKKLILLNALALAFPLAIQAKTLTPANTLKIKSPDGLTSIKDLTVSLSVFCSYRSGIFWPEGKTCGSKTTKLAISENGEVAIPETETFSGLHAAITDNYEISISVYEGKQYLGILSARGKEAILDLANNKKDLNILRFKEAHLAVAKDGADFFNSELAKNEKAYLLFSIKPSVSNGSFNHVLVISSLNSFLDSLENRFPYPGKLLLKDAKELFVPATALAYLGEEKNIDLNIRLTVSEINNGSHDVETKAEVKVPASNTALSDLGTIELK